MSDVQQQCLSLHPRFVNLNLLRTLTNMKSAQYMPDDLLLLNLRTKKPRLAPKMAHKHQPLCVVDQLAMARAFGDARLKEHITAEPDVRSGRVDKERDELMILASDGLWKVMSNQEAVDCVRKADDDDDADQAAKMLIREALSRNSCDDISCVVVMFE